MSDTERTFTIRLSAVLDRSTAAVGQPMVESMSRARARVDADARAMGASLARAVKAGTDSAARSAADAAARIARSEAEAGAAAQRAAVVRTVAAANAAKRESDIAGRAFDERLRLRQREAKETEAYLRRITEEHRRAVETQERTEARAAARDKAKNTRDNERRREKYLRGLASDTFSNVGAVASGASRVAGDFSRGSGVKLDLGTYVERVVDAETKAQDIVNQVAIAGGKQPSGGARGLVNFARNVGARPDVSQGTNDVLGALGEFQAKSNDLATGQEVVGELGKLARAAGASFKDVGASAAFINAQLEASPDRAAKLLGIMRAITAQTAAGQIELADWAKYIPRIAAAANAFSGPYEQNIATLSALAQISVKAGRSNAAEASGSAAALSRDLRKSRTLKAWAAEGLNPFTDDTHTKLKGPEQNILDAVEKTKGDQARLAKLFPNVVSAAPAMALADIYNRAGGGAKGMEAARGELAQYKGALSPEQVDKLSAESGQTTKAKAERFNQQLEAVVASMADRVLPAMEKLAPKVLELADVFGKVVSWAAENPGQAITTAIVGSIAKAAIGNAVSIALEGALKSAVGGAGGMGGLGVLGTAGSALAIGMATFTVTSAIINATADKIDKGITESTNAETALRNALHLAWAAEHGLAQPEDAIKALEAAKKPAQERISDAERIKHPGNPYLEVADPFSPALDDVTFGKKTFNDIGKASNDAQHLSELKAEMAAVNAHLAALKSGVLQVQVTNMPANGPNVPQDGRRGVAGR